MPEPNAYPIVEILILRVEGSGPTSKCCNMVLASNGSWRGTVGGGNLERQLMNMAQQVAAGALPNQIAQFTLGSGGDQCCGGVVTVLVSAVPAELRDLVDDGTTRLYCVEQEAGPGLAGGWDNRGRWHGRRIAEFEAPAPERTPSMLSDHGEYREGAKWFVRPAFRRQPLWLFGAGHVARAICPIAVQLGYDVHVFDGRPEWNSPSAFPGEVTVHPYAMPQPADRPAEDTVVLIMTYSHVLDFELLEWFLPQPVDYLGVIGSRSKTSRFRHALAKQGHAREAIARLHMPIGLPGTGKAPAEVAVGVLAELLQRRHARQAVVPGRKLRISQV